MRFNRLSYLAGVAAIFLTVGCGGSKNNVSGTGSSGQINFGGEQGTSTSFNVPTVPATGGTTVTAGGETIVVPSGSNFSGTPIGSTASYAIIPAGTGFTGTFSPGSQVTVNGVPTSGAVVGTDGKLDLALALPATTAGTSYDLKFPGGTVDTRALTIQSMSFSGKFYLNPLSIPVPYTLAGKIPNNGENAAGADVTAFFVGCNGRTATLTIYYTANHTTGFKLQQTQTIASDKARFRNFTTDAQNVPATGVDEISLVVGDK